MNHTYMLESWLATLRDGLEAALVIGFIIGCLRKTGRSQLVRWALAGLVLGLAASALGAWALANLPVNEELFEGAVMLLVSFCLAAAALWINREGLSRGAVPAALLIAFMVVFRKGVEAAEDLGEAAFNTSGIMSLAGILAAALASALFGVCLVKAGSKIEKRRFLGTAKGILWLLAAELLIGGAHEFGEAGLLPLGPRAMAIAGPIVKNSALFLMGMLAWTAALLLLPSKESAEEPRLEELSGPQRRLAFVSLRTSRFWQKLSAAGAIGALSFVGAGYVYSRGPKSFDPPVEVSAKRGRILLPIDSIDDGILHRFAYASAGGVIRFLALKVKEGDIRTAYDACAVCGAKGYTQKGSRINCLNCVAEINSETIGRRGGCNPIPLKSSREGGQLVILASDLEKEAAAFDGDPRRYATP